MTFEEKLDKLMERHEALSQTVVLIGHELQEIAAAQKILTQNVNKLVEVSNRDAVDILKLAHIAQDHEDRIKDLEQGH